MDLGDIDPFSAFFVTGSGVALREMSEETGAVIRRLSWELVTLEPGEQPDANYALVRDRDGRLGTIDFRYLRSAVGYRLIAVRGDDGQFQVTAFIAGD